MQRLITIGISHYCEKARWALDRAAIKYREDAHLPVFQRWSARRAAKVKQVPIFVPDDGPPITDSTDIMAWADTALTTAERLFPDEAALGAEVRELTAHLDATLAPATRVAVFGYILPELGKHISSSAAGEPAYERVLLRMAVPIARRLIRTLYTITPATIERSVAETDASFAEVGDLLADGRRFLTGDRFTAADLTFAAVAGPVINRSFQGAVVPDATLPEGLKPLVEGWRATPAGQFATRLYDDHRGRP